MARIPGPNRLALGLALLLLAACEEMAETIDDNTEFLQDLVDDGKLTVYRREF